MTRNMTQMKSLIPSDIDEQPILQKINKDIMAPDKDDDDDDDDDDGGGGGGDDDEDI